jgi:phospholipid/cholesterol/gamma-HCH transport system substrate-binding protein
MKMDWQARELTMEILVGAFVLMVLLGMGYFTIILTRETWFRKQYKQEAVFADVMGLRDGDSVVVRGMPVGKVSRLVLTNDGVHVLMSLDQPIQPRKDCKLTIVSTSMLGGLHLEIDEGTSPEVLPEGSLLHGDKPMHLMEDAADAINAIKKGLVDGGIMDNLKRAIEQISEIAERANAGKGTLGKLLSADDTLYKDLSAAVASFKTISARLEKGEGTLGRLLSSDDQLYKDISETAASLKAISGRLERGEGTLGKMLSKDDRMYQDLSTTLSSLKNITAKIERGEGTIGKLVQDETAYTELTKTLTEARAAVDDFRENTPVVTFVSLLFGAL